MISPARKLSYRILQQIEFQNVFSDDALNSAGMREIEVRDRHLTTQIVYGTLRWQLLLDYILAKSSARPWQNVTPEAKILLRMSLYQMWGMDRIPSHALVNDAVELAKKELGRGIDRYLNGMLRNLARTSPWGKEEFLEQIPPWVQASLPQWLWERWVGRYGEEVAKEYALSLNVPPQTALRRSNASGSDALPLDHFASDIVPDSYISPKGVRPSEDAGGDQPADLHFQDEASQLIPHLLGPAETGFRIWDACAAPGGKSAILGHICGKAGRLIASDLRADRIQRLVGTLRSSGLLNADVIIADASGSAPFRGEFDAVMADVPCSGLGTLRRNPEIKWRCHPERLTSFREIQKQILRSVAQSVRLGGRLLYSTCSTEPEENEEVIEDFLNTHPDFHLHRPDYPPGIERWTGSDSAVRTFPAARLWDGFFAALLLRRE
jgi:16S rRNA (cytosine967-C5)-methyltransferase